MEKTPRATKLYYLLGKDYQPKQAEMNICGYLEQLTDRVSALEAALMALQAPEDAEASDDKPKRIRRTRAEIEAANAENAPVVPE